MTLDDFKTEGPRTYTPEGERATKQEKFGTRQASHAVGFEDEWGKTALEAENDLEFVAERIEEAENVRELCVMFDWLEHTFVTKAAECVKEGHIDVERVPNVTHEDYNDKPISFYIKQYNENASVTSNTPASQQTSTSNDDDEEEDFSSGLGNFVS